MVKIVTILLCSVVCKYFYFYFFPLKEEERGPIGSLLQGMGYILYGGFYLIWYSDICLLLLVILFCILLLLCIRL